MSAEANYRKRKNKKKNKNKIMNSFLNTETGDKTPTVEARNLKEVHIYTDGSCLKNPSGVGAGCAVLVYKGTQRIVVDGERTTTCNRMEILSAIIGLNALKYPCRVTIYSDSLYVVNAIQRHWLERWLIKKGRDRIKNMDLWERLMQSMKTHEIKFEWIKGHNGHPMNELADRYAREHAVKLKRAG